MNKLETVQTVTKGLISAIPYLGGTITSVWSDIQAERKHERLLQFYSDLDKEVVKIKENLNFEYISRTDFLDVFETNVKYIINERNSDKRELFKNILLNGMTDKTADYDKTEKYLKIVEEMSNFELLLLKVFVNPVKFNEDKGLIILNPNKLPNGVRNLITYTKKYTVIELLKELLPEFNKDDIVDALFFLERNRIVSENISNTSTTTNRNPIDLLKGRLTSKGKDFVLYILRNPSDPLLK